MISGFCAQHPTPVPQPVGCRDFDRPYVLASCLSFVSPQASKLTHSAARPLPTKQALRGPHINGCASGRHALHEFSHGTLCKGKPSCSHRVCLPRIRAPCDAPPPQGAAVLSFGTLHKKDALTHSGRGFVSTPCRTYGVQPGPGRTSRSGGSPVSDVPHRTVLPLGWDSRGRNTVSLVFLAPFHLPLGIKKASAGSLLRRPSVLMQFSML